ncbi:MAG: SDR family NAD(P)-dependent oxidoreductase [Candidatus Binataceae bacterium]
MGTLEGKVAIVTGAARGQGEAEARLFVAEGAKVMLTDVSREGERWPKRWATWRLFHRTT